MTISRERFTNAVETTLNGTINNSVTSVVVTDGSTFPTANFRVKIENELLFCSSRSSNTLTVIRGQEGTTAASHTSGLPVNHVVTAASLQAFRRQILGNAGIIDPNDSVSADDDDFDDENFSGWSLVERTSWAATIVEANHRASFMIPAGTDGGQLYGYMKAKVPSAGNYVQAGFQWMGAGLQYPMFGLGFSDGVTYGSGNQAFFSYSPGQNQFYYRGFTGWNTNTSYTGGNSLYGQVISVMHMRLVWNSSNNYDFLVSPDGLNWATVFSAVTPGSVGTPSHAGIILCSWSSAIQVYSATYCRFNW